MAVKVVPQTRDSCLRAQLKKNIAGHLSEFHNAIDQQHIPMGLYLEAKNRGAVAQALVPPGLLELE